MWTARYERNDFAGPDKQKKFVKQPNNAGTRTDNGPTSFDNPLYAEAGGAGVMKENPLADTDQDGEESGGGGYLEVGITSNG